MTNRTNPTTRCLGLMIGLEVLILMSLWTGYPAATSARADGIPDAGEQRERLIDSVKATNAKLDALMTLLSGGKLEVTLHKADATR